MDIKADIAIIGTGVSGLYCALNLPENKSILMITKSSLNKSDSFLAQGGMCALKNADDYESFFNDTLKAGHYENDQAAVRKMIKSSPEIVSDLLSVGVEFEQENGTLLYTKEGAHSASRILFHKDITGKEITEKLLACVKKKKNVTLLEYTELIDIITYHNRCTGIVIRTKDGQIVKLDLDYTVLATGGVGGLYTNSTNYSHLTGDSLALAIRHHIKLKNINYIQIHPTTLYSKKPGRRFLISESVRGEGAYLYNAKMERFADELLPRDLLTNKINEQMKKEGSEHVWLSVAHLGSENIIKRFPNIYKRCLEEGIDITKDCIPVTPAQHYFMGGIAVDLHSKTSMNHLYAVGETSCNGVHGANRLASNSLLESLVFAKAAAKHILGTYQSKMLSPVEINLSEYNDYEKLQAENKQLVRTEIERANQNEQRNNFKIKCG